MPNSPTKTIRIPADLLEELKQESEAQGRPLNNYIVWLLSQRKKA